MTRAVVFDFGNVLFRWQPHVLLARVLPHHAPDEAAAHALNRRFFQAYEGDWGDFDRGTVEVDELATRIATRTGIAESDVHAVIAAIPEALEPMPATVALLRRLHAAGHALYFLSNMPEPMAKHLETAHDFVGLFRRGVFSARVRLVKPEPAIYAHAADHFGHAPQRLVFIDDHEPNIVAARATGWDAVHFVDAEGLEAALKQRGLLA